MISHRIVALFCNQKSLELNFLARREDGHPYPWHFHSHQGLLVFIVDHQSYFCLNIFLVGFWIWAFSSMCLLESTKGWFEVLGFLGVIVFMLLLCAWYPKLFCNIELIEAGLSSLALSTVSLNAIFSWEGLLKFSPGSSKSIWTSLSLFIIEVKCWCFFILNDPLRRNVLTGLIKCPAVLRLRVIFSFLLGSWYKIWLFLFGALNKIGFLISMILAHWAL